MIILRTGAASFTTKAGKESKATAHNIWISKA